MDFESYTYDRRLPLYHGARASFDKPKLNALGILWLTPNPIVAAEYSTPYYHKGESYLWKVYLKPGAKIIELGDVSNPIINDLREQLNSSFYQLGPVSAEEWPRIADFGIMESKRWVRGYLRKKRVDGLTVKDTLSSTPIQHDSVALLHLGAIDSMEKQVLPAGSRKPQTIGDIQQEIERWKPDLS
jgi:hypothetical protein